MGSIEPTPEALRAFVEGPEDGPITMINLLRFREQAQYADDADETPCTGPEAYGRYSETVQSLIGRSPQTVAAHVQVVTIERLGFRPPTRAPPTFV